MYQLEGFLFPFILICLVSSKNQEMHPSIWTFVIRLYWPCCIGCGFGSALGAAFPDAVSHVVPDGSQDLRELSRPVIQVQWSNTRQVSPQVSMDPWALDADQRTQVETGPGGIWRTKKERVLQEVYP